MAYRNHYLKTSKTPLGCKAMGIGLSTSAASGQTGFPKGSQKLGFFETQDQERAETPLGWNDNDSVQGGHFGDAR